MPEQSNKIKASEFRRFLNKPAVLVAAVLAAVIKRGPITLSARGLKGILKPVLELSKTVLRGEDADGMAGIPAQTLISRIDQASEILPDELVIPGDAEPHATSLKPDLAVFCTILSALASHPKATLDAAPLTALLRNLKIKGIDPAEALADGSVFEEGGDIHPYIDNLLKRLQRVDGEDLARVINEVHDTLYGEGEKTEAAKVAAEIITPGSARAEGTETGNVIIHKCASDYELGLLTDLGSDTLKSAAHLELDFGPSDPFANLLGA